MRYITSLTLLSLFAVHTLMAQPMTRPRDGLRQLKEDLNLSDEQKVQLKALRSEKHRKQDLVEDARDAREKLRSLLSDPDASDQQINAALEHSNKTLTEANTARIQHLLQLRKILTKEQRNVIRQRLQGRVQSMGGFRDREGPGRFRGGNHGPDPRGGSRPPPHEGNLREGRGGPPPGDPQFREHGGSSELDQITGDYSEEDDGL